CSFLCSTPTPELPSLSLHDALPISVELAGLYALGCRRRDGFAHRRKNGVFGSDLRHADAARKRHLGHAGRCTRAYSRRNLRHGRSEEHTSELQSLTNLVCRLLL